MTAEVLDPNFSTATDEGAQALLKNLIGYYIIMEGVSSTLDLYDACPSTPPQPDEQA